MRPYSFFSLAPDVQYPHTMDNLSFSAVFDWIIHHGYALMFFAMFLEGPVVTSVAAFAASLGYFSLPVVWILSICGDLLGDIVYYFIGYFGRLAAVSWGEKRFHVAHERIEKIAKLVKEHKNKTIIALKLMPFVVLPGFIVVGMSRVKFSRFVLLCLTITVIRNSLSTALGYYAGEFFKLNNDSWEKVQNYMVLSAIIIAILFLCYRKVVSFIAKKLEDI